MQQILQEASYCQRHPSNHTIGICLSRNFLKDQEKNDWKICQKCMSIYSKVYNDFLLFEDINDKNEYQIEEYPFDQATRKIKDFLNEKQTSHKKVFSNEIELVDQLIEQLKEIKQQLVNLQESNEKLQINIYNQIKQLYSDVYGIKHIRQALKQNCYKLESNQEIELMKSELHQTFNQLYSLKEGQEIKQQINNFQQGAYNFINERLLHQFDNYQQIINQLGIEKLSVEQNSMQPVQLVRSKVPYPDALNTILYPHESFSENSQTYKVVFIDNQNFEDKCHFFVGCIDSELKDAIGYNHDMPCICFICHLKQKEVSISNIKQLSITIAFDIKQNQVTYNFIDNVLNQHSVVVSYNFQPFKEWKLFISTCFQLKFKVYKC
ncbi:hypothetical protein ABPG72_016970 [Tetrahymena utriculariae]